MASPIDRYKFPLRVSIPSLMIHNYPHRRQEMKDQPGTLRHLLCFLDFLFISEIKKVMALSQGIYLIQIPGKLSTFDRMIQVFCENGSLFVCFVP